MKILITGTNGFVGRNLKEYLGSKGHDLFCPKRAELDLVEAGRVHDYLKQHRFDVVIHCAITLLSVEQNLKMYFNLECCRSFFGKMICVGSGAEYGKDHYVPQMKEEYFAEHVPADIYGFSKYVVARDIENPPRNIFNLRVFGIFGKYEDYRRRFISNNICRVLSGMDISINRNMYFDYLYVDDFARILDMFMCREPRCRSYNVCTGRSVDLVTLAQIIRKVDGKGRPVRVREEGFAPEYSGDNGRFREEFGAFDFTPPEQAITQLYNWYRDQGAQAFDAGQLK